jgi:hypothetical protein
MAFRLEEKTAPRRRKAQFETDNADPALDAMA